MQYVWPPGTETKLLVQDPKSVNASKNLWINTTEHQIWYWEGYMWQYIAAYGNLWQLMATYGILWYLMATYGNLWQLMATIIRFFGCTQIFACIHNVYRSIHLLQRLRISEDSAGSPKHYLAAFLEKSPTLWNSNHFHLSTSSCPHVLGLFLQSKRMYGGHSKLLWTECAHGFSGLWPMRDAHLFPCKTVQRPTNSSMLLATSSSGLPSSPSPLDSMMELSFQDCLLELEEEEYEWMDVCKLELSIDNKKED